MTSTATTWLRVANDVVHDLSAGVWPGAALSLWLVRSRTEGVLSPTQLDTAVRAWSPAFTIMLAALATLVVTGLYRARYRHIDVSPGALSSRTRVVLVKHTVFVLIFVLSTVVALTSLQP